MFEYLRRVSYYYGLFAGLRSPYMRLLFWAVSAGLSFFFLYYISVSDPRAFGDRSALVSFARDIIDRYGFIFPWTVLGLSLPLLFPIFLAFFPSAKSESETSAATERTVAASAETLTRDFQTRIDTTINKAVGKLSSQADELIKQHLGERVDVAVGDNLIEYLGEKLSERTEEQSRQQALSRLASDAFELMRSRALQYAEAANRQSTFFRWVAVTLAFVGLLALGWVLINQRGLLSSKPELMTQHVEWATLVLTNGPTYAFVVLSEFLALMMFRYQSKALEFMRYFSNEATNIDARRIGFFTTLSLLDKASLKKLVEKLEATERNFLISKDQRTLELANNENEDRMFDRLQRVASFWKKEEAAHEGKKAKAQGKSRVS